MASPMSFVYVKDTLQVLGVLTGLTPYKAPLTADDLASPTLMVRDFSDSGASPSTVTQSFYLTPDLLDVFTGDIVDDALLDPRNYSYDAVNKTVAKTAGPGSMKPTFAASVLTITLTSAAAKDLAVRLFYPGSDPAKSLVLKGSIPTTSNAQSFSSSSWSVGMYVLVVVEGYAPVVAQVS